VGLAGDRPRAEVDTLGSLGETGALLSFGERDQEEGPSVPVDLDMRFTPARILRGERGAGGSGVTDMTSMASLSSSSSISTLERGMLSRLVRLVSPEDGWVGLPSTRMALPIRLDPTKVPVSSSNFSSEGTGNASARSGTSSNISKYRSMHTRTMSPKVVEPAFRGGAAAAGRAPGVFHVPLVMDAAPGTAHILTSRIGSFERTRLGEMHKAKLCASILLTLDRRDTSCRRSLGAGNQIMGSEWKQP
jgi:hypothetical protein